MQPGYLQMGSFAKGTAHQQNCVTVDPGRLDASGIPTPVVHFRFSDNDRALCGRQPNQNILEMFSPLKGKVFPSLGKASSGFANHEVGTVRMGKDPRASMLNSYCRARDVKNLFVTDGSCFTTSSEKNPLTIMALFMRAADYIRDRRRKEELYGLRKTSRRDEYVRRVSRTTLRLRVQGEIWKEESGSN
jgi:choline dehydrogenase-like flavoprotein